ncbi:MAG: cytochrome c oxidase subunit II [Oligoflexia bacterium]|nr:cytochrome c oxidase subunit II [Oligoflexia bacterium]
MLSLSLNFLPSASVSGDKFMLYFTTIFIIGTILFVGTLGVGIYFAFKYKRKSDNDETPYIPHNYLVEFLSVFGISVWVAIFFIWGWRDYKDFISPKMDEYEINVIGQQWNWQIQYANGKTFTNELIVPVDRHIHLAMTSKDVLHSFFIPEFRVKMDTIPGQYTSLRFTPNKVGTYTIYCAEYCGTSHSKMIGKVYVLSQKDFQDWLDGVYQGELAQETKPSNQDSGNGMTLVEAGEHLYRSKTCYTCHTTNGDTLIGPSFKGLFGSEVELIGGTKILADENYIRESLMDPMKKVVKGFSPTMPTYRGMLTDTEINQIVAFIKAKR